MPGARSFDNAQFFPKEGSYSLRMGLMHAADGWNVADQTAERDHQA